MSFDKTALFAALKPKTKAVLIDGVGNLTAKELSVAQINGIRSKLKAASGSDDAFGLNMVVLSFVDDEGSPIFSDSDLATLSESSNAEVEKLVFAVLELNGFKKADDAKN